MKRVKAVIVKEFAHILRDPTSLVIVFAMPVLMLLIYSYAMNFDLNQVETGIIDHSQSDLSSKLISKFENNQYYRIVNLNQFPAPMAAGERLLKSGKLKQFIVIPNDFSSKIHTGRKAEIGIVIDGNDSNVANLVHQYNEMVIMDYFSLFLDVDRLVKVKTKIYFNPEVKSSFFFIPGLIAVLLVMISALLTSISIAREKESGSIDLIFISPLKSVEIIVGKTIPYIVVALIVEIIIIAFSKFWFHIPIKGNLFILLIFSVLYITSGLSLGILISTIAPNQKTAMFAALLGTLLPSIMLSGFIFPLDSLAPFLRALSYGVPATYFLKIIRGVVLKGAELKHFLYEGLAMVVFSFFLITLAVIKFSKNRNKAR